jgi:hypothetical protein
LRLPGGFKTDTNKPGIVKKTLTCLQKTGNRKAARTMFSSALYQAF